MKTLYRASLVHTLSLAGDGDWVLVDDRHVERVGAGDPPSSDRVVDLPGTTILPGFVDAHVHLTGTGTALDGLDLSRVGSREEMLRAVREHAQRNTGPVLGQRFDESKWEDPSLPGRAALDAVSREPVVIVRTDSYLSLVNTSALRESGAEGMDGVERDREGVPTGRVQGPANSMVQLWYYQSLPADRVEGAQLRAAALAAARGVTCVHEMAIPDKLGRRDLEILLGHMDDLPVHVVPYVADRDIPWVLDLGLPRIGGDLFLDGSIGARSAALLEPYADEDGRGSPQYEDDELATFLHTAHLAGLQTGLHVIGDAAIEQALTVWERVYRALDTRERRHFRARRHRLEHFEMASPSQVERAAALGLAISVQPSFDATWGHDGGMYQRRLGPDRAAAMNPFRSMVERGIEVGAGSDTPVTPLDPMLGIHALETHHHPDQRMSRLEAVSLFTRGAARIGHQEKKGRLEPGSAADLAAYEVDPLETPDILGVRPVLAVSRGRDVYAR